ncbi:MAG: hypothetical protein RIT81_39330 [Deltaproteobacteria bacterium]
MPTKITAHVIAEHGAEFDADLTNMGPHFAFVRAASGLEFREAVTLKFNDVSVHGEVAFVCRNPAGAVVVFNASPEATNVIEDLMEDAEVVMGADAPPPEPPPQWDDNTAVGEDSEDPTNPALKPVAVPVHVEEHIYETSATPEEAEVRRAFARTLPPNYATEPLDAEALDKLRKDPPTVEVVDNDESTLVPEARARARTVVAEMDTDHGSGNGG